MYGKRIVGDLAAAGEKARLYGAFLHSQGADPGTTRLITDDPDQMYVTNGYPSIQLPGNGAAAIAQLATDLHATHVLLDTKDHPIPIPELRSQLHPIAVAPVPNTTVILLTLPAASNP